MIHSSRLFTKYFKHLSCYVPDIMHNGDQYRYSLALREPTHSVMRDVSGLTII